VIDGLTAARVDPVGDPTIIEGFDLDGRVSDRDDEDGCLWEDRTSPPPESEMGVDNMLGPTFDAFLAYFAEDLDFGPQIARGMHLIVIEIRQDGDAVQLDLSEVVTMDRGAPVLDDDGRLVADQELELVRLLGRIEGTGGTTIEVGPGAADLPILATHPDTTVLDPFRARVRMQDDGTAEGVLGGGIDVEAAAAFAVAVNPEAIPESVARSAASAQADLAPDAEGNCTRISGAWTFTAVPARIRR
jgi:hypothetical protein